LIDRVFCFLESLTFGRDSRVKLFNISCVFILLFFQQNASAQSNVDSVIIQPQKTQLNLYFVDSNHYKFQVSEIVQDSFVFNDSNLGVYTLDSVVLVIQNWNEILKQKQNFSYNDVVLYILNLNYKMEEMRLLFEKLSEIGIRVKVEFPPKK